MLVTVHSHFLCEQKNKVTLPKYSTSWLLPSHPERSSHVREKEVGATQEQRMSKLCRGPRTGIAGGLQVSSEILGTPGGASQDWQNTSIHITTCNSINSPPQVRQVTVSDSLSL